MKQLKPAIYHHGAYQSPYRYSAFHSPTATAGLSISFKDLPDQVAASLPAGPFRPGDEGLPVGIDCQRRVLTGFAQAGDEHWLGELGGTRFDR